MKAYLTEEQRRAVRFIVQYDGEEESFVQAYDAGFKAAQ